MVSGLGWNVLALLASFFWGSVNLLDKTILSRYRLNPWDYLALDGFVGLLPLAAIFLWFDDPLSTPTEAILLAMASGVALAIFSLLYFYALQISDVAIVVILTQLIPVFSLIWGLMLLQEQYESESYIGMFLVLLGAVIASVSEKKEKSSKQGKTLITKTATASFLMCIATFVMSIGFLIQKIALQDAGILCVFFWQRFFLVVVSFVIIVARRAMIRKLTFMPIILTSLIEVVNLLGVLSIIAAYSQGPLVAVSFLSSLQPVWVTGLTWVLSLTKSKLVPTDENISRLYLIIASVFVVLGLYLMQ